MALPAATSVSRILRYPWLMNPLDTTEPPHRRYYLRYAMVEMPSHPLSRFHDIKWLTIDDAPERRLVRPILACCDALSAMIHARRERFTAIQPPLLLLNLDAWRTEGKLA